MTFSPAPVSEESLARTLFDQLPVPTLQFSRRLRGRPTHPCPEEKFGVLGPAHDKAVYPIPSLDPECECGTRYGLMFPTQSAFCRGVHERAVQMVFSADGSRPWTICKLNGPRGVPQLLMESSPLCVVRMARGFVPAGFDLDEVETEVGFMSFTLQSGPNPGVAVKVRWHLQPNPELLKEVAPFIDQAIAQTGAFLVRERCRLPKTTVHQPSS